MAMSRPIARDNIVLRSFQKVRIQNYFDHTIVVKLEHSLYTEICNPYNYFFVGITNLLIKCDEQNPEFEDGDHLYVYYFVPETGEKKLFLSFNLTTTNLNRFQHYNTATQCNYRMLYSGGKNIVFTFQTSIGPDRLFKPIKVEFDVIVRN